MKKRSAEAMLMFVKDSPYKPKVVKAKKAYTRKVKHRKGDNSVE